MRAVVQRVSWARVWVVEELVGEIGPGLCALVAVAPGDDEPMAAALAAKLWHLRVFDDAGGAMNHSVAETTKAVLVVSQFTLYGDTSRGRRPSWAAAAPAADAEPLVEAVVAQLRARGATVATGRFGASMRLELANDGPVTLLVDV
ncbi:MAG: D-aminoacyl-tRNA deacylase [Acidimicrobiales bacterium]